MVAFLLRGGGDVGEDASVGLATADNDRGVRSGAGMSSL